MNPESHGDAGPGKTCILVQQRPKHCGNDEPLSDWFKSHLRILMPGTIIEPNLCVGPRGEPASITLLPGHNNIPTW